MRKLFHYLEIILIIIFILFLFVVACLRRQQLCECEAIETTSVQKE